MSPDTRTELLPRSTVKTELLVALTDHTPVPAHDRASVPVPATATLCEPEGTRAETLSDA